MRVGGLSDERWVGSGLTEKTDRMTTDASSGPEARGDTTPITTVSDGAGLMLDPVTGEPIDEKELADQLSAQARPGRQPGRPGGLLSSLTKQGWRPHWMPS